MLNNRLVVPRRSKKFDLPSKLRTVTLPIETTEMV